MGCHFCDYITWECHFCLAGRLSLFAFSAYTLPSGKANMVRNCTWPFSQHQRGSEALSKQARKFWQHHLWAWDQILPKLSLQRRPQSQQTAPCSLWKTVKQRTHQPMPTFLAFRNCEIIECVLLRTANLWWLVTQQQITDKTNMFLESSWLLWVYILWLCNSPLGIGEAIAPKSTHKDIYHRVP